MSGIENKRRILDRRHGFVGAGRFVVDRTDVDVDGVRCLVEVHPAVGRATVILDLESEARVLAAVGVLVGRRRERQFVQIDIRQRDEVAGRDRHSVEFQRAIHRKRADLDAAEGVGRTVAGVGEAKIGRRQQQRLVLVDRQRVVRPRGRVVDRTDVDHQRVRRRAILHAVMHFEVEGLVGRAVLVGRRCVLEITVDDFVHRYDLIDDNRLVPERQPPRGTQGGDLYLGKRVGLRVQVSKVTFRKRDCGVLVGRNGCICPGRWVIRRRDVDGDGCLGAEVYPAVRGAAVILHLKAERIRSGESGAGRIKYR